MIIPDTNLLLYAYNAKSPLHSAARSWWEGAISGEEEIGLPWVVSTGFVRISTHSTALTRPLTLERALAIVSEWLLYPHVAPLNPGSQHLPLLSELLGQLGVGGRLVTDAHIAALAIEHQAEVHTNDSDFARFPGLRWRNPLMSPA